MNDDVLILEAGRTERHYWADLFRYRDVFYLLAKRDVSVRYKQTAMGVSWALLRPLMTMLVFTFVFGRIAKLPSDGVPYSLLVFSGMLPWFFFSSSVSDSSSSLISNANLLSKVYFPRILVPASAVLVAVVDLTFSALLLIPLMLYFGVYPSWRLILLPFFLFVGFSSALGIGLWFSALNVKYRDFQFVVPFVVQFGLYLSPIGFSSSVVPDKWRLLYVLNPMVGVVEGFRWALLGEGFDLKSDAQLVSIAVSSVLFASGVWFFRRVERHFADII